MALEDLKKDEMMTHLIGSLEGGQDIGHYGRLVFAMIARHFIGEEEVIQYLMKDKDGSEEKARGLLEQVKARNYNPPKKERILEWMSQQRFPICNEPDNPDACNVYRNLQFPEQVYQRISEYYEQRAEASGHVNS
jgi:uncharacterized protein YozE (UPF0346 family)